MINIKIQLTRPSESERQSGQLLFYEPIADFDGVHSVSVSANVNGFTPLTAIVNHYQLDSNKITEITYQANVRNEVGVYPIGNPRYLLVVPKTNAMDKNNETRLLMTDLLNACEYFKIDKLHFYHFAMVLSDLNMETFDVIFSVLAERCATINMMIVFALDYNQVTNFRQFLNEANQWPIDLVIEPF